MNVATMTAIARRASFDEAIRALHDHLGATGITRQTVQEHARRVEAAAIKLHAALTDTSEEGRQELMF